MTPTIIIAITSFAVGYFIAKRGKPSYYDKYVEAEFERRMCEDKLKTCKNDRERGYNQAKAEIRERIKPMQNNNEELIEKLADIEHQRWSDWQKYVFSKCEVLIDGSTMIPKWAVDQWTRQINTPYKDLTEKEKESDRCEVRRYLPIVSSQISQAEQRGKREGLEEAVGEYVAPSNDRERGYNQAKAEIRERIKQILE